MNEHFVSIKVDREERPDVDAIYMSAVQAHDRPRRLADDRVPHARWRARSSAAPTSRPTTATACPASRACSTPSPTLLDNATRRADASRRGQLVERLAAAGRAASAPASDPLDRGACSTRACQALRGEFDARARRLRRRAQVPAADDLDFLLRYSHRRDRRPERRCEMVASTLDAMARGGIYDQLGGGFHRYSRRRSVWLVPHFEKMLYDNAQLARALPAGLPGHRRAASTGGSSRRRSTTCCAR